MTAVATREYDVVIIGSGVEGGPVAATSALDPMCKAWDHNNLYVVDAGFFPSSAAVNPALTSAAQALRVGHQLRTEAFQ